MPADGSLDYIEIPVSDMAATKQFYASVFGWAFTDYGPDYAAFEVDGRNGGFNAERKVVKEGGPLIVLYANDLDAMEARVKKAGAEIILHHEFPGGRRFIFAIPAAMRLQSGAPNHERALVHGLIYPGFYPQALELPRTIGPRRMLCHCARASNAAGGWRQRIVLGGNRHVT